MYESVRLFHSLKRVAGVEKCVKNLSRCLQEIKNV